MQLIGLIRLSGKMSKSNQIGSDEKPVMFRKTIAGKGSKARPGVYSQEYRDNFDRIFNKPTK